MPMHIHILFTLRWKRYFAPSIFKRWGSVWKCIWIWKGLDLFVCPILVTLVQRLKYFSCSVRNCFELFTQRSKCFFLFFIFFFSLHGLLLLLANLVPIFTYLLRLLWHCSVFKRSFVLRRMYLKQVDAQFCCCCLKKFSQLLCTCTDGKGLKNKELYRLD